MNGDLACIDIVIVDDDDVEGDEQFQLEIVDSNFGTIASPSVTTVTIHEDAGIITHTLYQELLSSLRYVFYYRCDSVSSK